MAYVKNMSDAEIHIHPGMLCAGFGKGKFKSNSKEFSEEKHVMFKLSESDMVLIDNVYTSVKDALAARKASSGEVKIRYHEITELQDQSLEMKLVSWL